MIILGHGIDLVDVAKVTQLITKRSDAQLLRIFTANELAYCSKNPRRKSEHLAARFAAKEAVAKALGTGFTQGVAWFEIEVDHDNTGRPIVRLLGKTVEVAKSLGVVHLHLSLTHINQLACASVIAEGQHSTSSASTANAENPSQKTVKAISTSKKTKSTKPTTSRE